MSLASDLQRAVQGPIELDAALAPRTSMRVGGTADLLVTPPSEEALAQALKVCQDHGAPWLVLGGGTNTVVSDRGVRGVVFRLSPRLVEERSEPLLGDWPPPGGRSLTLGAGSPLARLIALSRASGCVGMEFLAGIPGTVGGAVVMNAGTRLGSLERICVEVGLCSASGVQALSASEVGFAYRNTRLPHGAVVTRARFELPLGTPEALLRSRKLMEQEQAARRRTQPLNLPSSGSVFRNPPGDHAGRLIEACGLKGLQEGGAQISEVHANFIVNRGGARASDVLALMRRMQDAVLERFGVLLVPEVKLVGELDAQELPRGVGAAREPAA